MKYAKKFNTKNEYNSYIEGSGKILPNVSYILETEDTKFNEKKQLYNYVAMTASAAQTVTAPVGKSFEYSYNTKEWNAMTSAINFGTEGQKTIYIRGKNVGGINSTFTFGNADAKVSIFGNAQSLLDWETLPSEVPANGFSLLFSNAKALQSVSVDFLPATTLSNFCYNGLFSGCTSLKNAPSLPSTTLAQGCYSKMFSNCGSMVTPPELPATTLADGCYSLMFDGCASLAVAPSLPATSLTEYCYTNMFYGCISLKKAPHLPALTLIRHCYYRMFYNCQLLNEVHCDAMYNMTADIALIEWLSGVSSTGNFYGKIAANWPDGTNGIPNGWTKHLS